MQRDDFDCSDADRLVIYFKKWALLADLNEDNAGHRACELYNSPSPIPVPVPFPAIPLEFYSDKYSFHFNQVWTLITIMCYSDREHESISCNVDNVASGLEAVKCSEFNATFTQGYLTKCWPTKTLPMFLEFGPEDNSAHVDGA